MKKNLIIITLLIISTITNIYSLSINDLIKQNKIPSFTTTLESITLDLSDRELNSLIGLDKIKDINKVQILKLNHNHINALSIGDIVALSKLTNLERLYLNNNNLIELPSSAFSHLENLKFLWLNNNKIVTIYANTFNGLKNLKGLDLRHNQLTIIPLNLFDWVKKRQLNLYVDLTGNKLTQQEQLKIRKAASQNVKIIFEQPKLDD